MNTRGLVGKKLASWLFLLSLPFFAHASDSTPEGAIYVEMGDLLADPDQYVGLFVTTAGYFNLGDLLSVLHLNEADYLLRKNGDPASKSRAVMQRMILISFRDDSLQSLSYGVGYPVEAYVEVTGRFIGRDEGYGLGGSIRAVSSIVDLENGRQRIGAPKAVEN